MILTDWLYDVFDGLTPEFVVLFIFLLFLLDAILVPTLPEVFFVLGFHNTPTPLFGCLLLLVAILGELVGIFSLYYVVKNVRVPAKVARVAEKYINFLLVSDEKALLINRIAPMIPFAGAFIALLPRWRPRVCAVYIVTGCIAKYGLILLASGFFITYLGGRTAQTVTIVFVIAIIIISFIASYIRKKRSGLEDSQ